MMWNGLPQSVDRLEHNLNGCCNSLRPEHFHYLAVDFCNSKRLVQISHTVAHLGFGLIHLCLAVVVGVEDELLHATFSYQFHGRTENAELFQARHVYAVIIRISYLGRTAYQHHLLGMQAVKNAYDTLLERGSSYDTVVYYHEVVPALIYATIGNVVDM